MPYCLNFSFNPKSYAVRVYILGTHSRVAQLSQIMILEFYGISPSPVLFTL